jgi:hypothetical protein
MNLLALYAAFGTPFPAGGRIAAMSDMEWAGIECAHQIADTRAERHKRQPTNRGLQQVAIIQARPTFGAKHA